MRYAIIRGGEGLPSPDVQRQGLGGIPCDVTFEEFTPTGKGERWLRAHLNGLQAQDEIVLWSLEVLQLSTADLLLLLLRLFTAGVTVRLTGSAAPETLDASSGLPRALVLLGEHEVRRPTRLPGGRRGRTPDRPLSPYQVKYARQLLRHGASRREVGLLFQLAPDELSAELVAIEDRSRSTKLGSRQERHRGFAKPSRNHLGGDMAHPAFTACSNTE